MRLTIDNLDGRGALDYSQALSDTRPLTLTRTLNGPTRCTAELLPMREELPMPARRGRVVVSSDAGVLLFTGYLVVEPTLRYLGAGSAGPMYTAHLTAVSDEWLLDKQGSAAETTAYGPLLGTSSGAIAEQLATVGTGSALSVVQSGNDHAVGVFALAPNAGWSTNTAAAANASYSVYQVLEGTVTLRDAGATTHVLQDSDGEFLFSELQTSQLRELANDVTLSGAREPSTFVQEILQGDGTTTVFPLSEAAFKEPSEVVLLDKFDEAAIDRSQWILSDPGNHVSLSGDGLAVQGGSGQDGQTTLAARNLVELGGALVVELNGVTLGAASDGMLASFYDGPASLNDCFAGFRVRQSASTTGGVTQLIPVLQGAEVGTAFTPQSDHRYTLRLRLYGYEMQRVPQRYYCMVDGVVRAFGSTEGVSTPVHVVFELIDEDLSSNTPATVLYDTAASGAPITPAPALCTFMLVNSAHLQVALRAVSLKQTGSMWVVSTTPDGRQSTRLAGAVGEGVDCMVDPGSDTGGPAKVTFFPGRIPQAGERITAFYRRVRRSVARLADQASIAAETTAGAGVSVPGVSCWLGKISDPPARSSADCEQAALAVLAMSTARSAALAGTCTLVNPSDDVWPGDLLALQQNGVDLLAMVRSVTATNLHAEPEAVRYEIRFANDWSTQREDGLGLRLSEGCASDADVPLTALSSPNAVLGGLQAITVLSLTSAAVQVDAGCDAPAGGGFEVRRRPEGFGPASDIGDLVLRSPVRSFSIPRSAQVERFFVRMYDGSATPLYSRFSHALYIDWPYNPAG